MTLYMGFYFNVTTSTEYIATPISLQPKNDLDAHGMLLDLRRLPSENGVDYYKRLRSVVPLRGGADIEGLTHAVTRELGLEEQTAIRIAPLSSAVSPRVDISPTKITLYGSYFSPSNYEVDLEVDFFDKDGPHLIGELVEYLQSSEHFEIIVDTLMDQYQSARGLIPSSSTVTISREVVPQGEFFYLDNTDVVPGTLTFSDKRAFAQEVSPEIASNVTGGMSFAFSVTNPVTAYGQYYVDYADGTVKVHTPSSFRASCSYDYRDFPWLARWSPVSIYSLRDSDYKEKVFERETRTDGVVTDGVVTDEGRIVYTDIFTRAHCLWGR